MGVGGWKGRKGLKEFPTQGSKKMAAEPVNDRGGGEIGKNRKV